MWIQHRHMVYGVLHMCYVLFLYQITHGNDCSTLFHHGVLFVDHKMEITETGFYYKTP